MLRLFYHFEADNVVEVQGSQIIHIALATIFRFLGSLSSVI
jgi:hypothetical protein